MASKSWGADSALLLRLFRALIRSKLDYGAVVYQSATQKNLDYLKPVQNEAIRICLGAFRSSPEKSLHREAGEMPMRIRHLQLSLQYIIRLKSNRNNPAYDIAIPQSSQDLDSDDSDDEDHMFSSGDDSPDEDFAKNKGRKNLPPTFLERMKPFVEDSEIPLQMIAHNKPSSIEPWTLAEPMINLNLSSFDKETTQNHIFISEHKAILSFYKGFQSIYTDGSKKDEKVGAAATWEYGALKTRLPDHSTVFNAEAVALVSAMKIAKVSHLKRFIVFTDSLSCLQAIQNEDLQNPHILEFLQLYTDCIRRLKRIVLCWVPGHVGIAGNEQADRLAKEALDKEITPYALHFSNLLPMAKEYFTNIWQDIWSSTPVPLSYYAPDVKQKMFSEGIGRKAQVVLSRVRIGHTNLTHVHLMKGEDQPVCAHCNTALSILHIMIDCPHFAEERSNNLFGTSMEEIFSNDDRNIIEFLKECNLFNKI